MCLRDIKVSLGNKTTGSMSCFADRSRVGKERGDVVVLQIKSYAISSNFGILLSPGSFFFSTFVEFNHIECLTSCQIVKI